MLVERNSRHCRRPEITAPSSHLSSRTRPCPPRGPCLIALSTRLASASNKEVAVPGNQHRFARSLKIRLSSSAAARRGGHRFHRSRPSPPGGNLKSGSSFSICEMRVKRKTFATRHPGRPFSCGNQNPGRPPHRRGRLLALSSRPRMRSGAFADRARHVGGPALDLSPSATPDAIEHELRFSAS